MAGESKKPCNKKSGKMTKLAQDQNGPNSWHREKSAFQRSANE